MIHPNLVSFVLELSKSADLKKAIKEWHIHSSHDAKPVGTTENGTPRYASSCLCGKEGIKEIYDIENNLTGRMLSPIGSKCVLSFNSELIDDQLKEHQKKHREKREQSPEFIDKEIRKFWAKIYNPETNEVDYEVDGSCFTRKLIQAFCDRGYFAGFYKPVTVIRTYRDLNAYIVMTEEEIRDLLLRKFNRGKLAEDDEELLGRVLDKLFVTLSREYKA